jgi:hypothetical protein
VGKDKGKNFYHVAGRTAQAKAFAPYEKSKKFLAPRRESINHTTTLWVH